MKGNLIIRNHKLGLFALFLVAAASCGQIGQKYATSAKTTLSASSDPSTGLTYTVPGSMGTSGATGSAGASVSYAATVSPYLQSNCVNCHSPGNALGGVDLSTYSAVMASVAAGTPTSSPLYNYMSNGSMPPDSTVNSTDLQSISNWISQGAQNN